MKEYYELGYKNATDVGINGNVNTNESGVYNIYYNSKCLFNIQCILIYLQFSQENSWSKN